MSSFVLLVVLAIVVVVGFVAAGVLVLDSRGDKEVRALEAGRAARLREAVDVAYQHLEISPALADALIDSSRDIDHGSAAQVQATTERLLALAREHRVDEPDLAVIIIDTLRRDAA